MRSLTGRGALRLWPGALAALLLALPGAPALGAGGKIVSVSGGKAKKGKETKKKQAEPVDDTGVESTAAPSTIRYGEEDPDRKGAPLGRGGGIGLVPKRQHDDGSFTFKAGGGPEDVTRQDEEPRPAPRAPRIVPDERRPAPVAPGAPRAPTSLVVPVDVAPEEDPIEPYRPPPSRSVSDIPARGGESRLLGEESATPPPSTWRPTSRNLPVEEVPVQYDRDSFIEVEERPAARQERYRAPPAPEPPPRPAAREPRAPAYEEPPARPAPAYVEEPPARPAPAYEEPPARARVEPPPEPPRVERAAEPAPPEPAPARSVARPVPAPASPEPDAALAPFDKLERELREIGEGRPEAPPAEKAPPPAETPRLLSPSEPSEPAEPARVAPPPRPARARRDPSVLGLSFGGGAGLLLAQAPQGGWTPVLGYGGHVAWNPSFFGPVSADLSAWRASMSGGTDTVSVGTSWLHLALRVLWTREAGRFVLGFGGGALGTLSGAAYVLRDGQEQSARASVLRPGLDGTLLAGFRLRPLDVRLEARVLLRGGWRLDFLPALNVGLAF